MITSDQILMLILVLWLLGAVGGVGGDLVHTLLVVALIIFLLRASGIII